MEKILFTATVDSHILQFHLPFLKLFKEKGYEVHVATNGNEKIPYCDLKHMIPFERKPFKLNNLKAIKKLKKICDEENFDIIHCHTPMGSVVTRLAARKARKRGTRVIYTAHGFHFYKGAPLINWILFYPVEWYLAKFTDTLITINQEDYQRAKKRFGKRCNDIQYVPGIGIDTKKFNFEMSEKEKNELRKSLGINEKDFVMIFSAEISKRKRQEWLINTIADLLKEYNNIHLLLPGKDSLNGKCQELTKRLKLENQIHFLGYRKDIPKLLKISNISISSAKQEGLPVNIMEAMYLGLPVIATNCRGNRDLVEDGKNGYLINLCDKEKFKNSILKIYLEDKENDELNKKNTKVYVLEKIMCDMKKIYGFTEEVKTLAIITSGFLPVPATKGGAVENLIDTLINQNERQKRVKLIIFSVYDRDAIEISEKYNQTDFVFIKISKIFEFIDEFNYFIIDKVFKKSNSRKFRYIFQRFDFLYKCSQYLKNNDYSKILLENHSILYLALKWKKNYLKYKDRYYYHCHNVVPSKYGMDNIISNTKKMISVSKFRNNYAKSFFNIKENRSGVVLNCCSDDVKRIASKREINLLKEKYNIKNSKVILYIGRVDKDKGTLEIVKACNQIKNKDFKLIVAGAPIFNTGITTEYENKVKEEIRKNDNFIMTGYVKHDELYKYYAMADIVVIPSQIDDSAPLVLLEALANGKPIIATNCGGIPEYVNEECSILIDRNEHYIENLSKSIEKILYNEDMLKKMSIASKEQSNLYSENAYYNDLINEIFD